MKNTFMLLFVLFLISNCGNAQTKNKESNKTTEENWEIIFDGTSLDNFRSFNADTLGSAWVIEDGTLTMNLGEKEGWQRKGGGDIMTKKQYENYELQLEWKIDSCGNSGIIHNIKEGPQYSYGWNTGPEMQILDNDCHKDGKIKTHRAGNLYDMIAGPEDVVKKWGEWNQVRIIVNNGHTEYWLNGKKVVEFTLFDDSWVEMRKTSKFKDLEEFGMIRKGHIALQDHGDKVWFRNIRIKNL